MCGVVKKPSLNSIIIRNTRLTYSSHRVIRHSKIFAVKLMWPIHWRHDPAANIGRAAEFCKLVFCTLFCRVCWLIVPSKNATQQLHREDFTVSLSYHFMQMKLINDYLDMTSSVILFLFSDCHLPSVWMECPWDLGRGKWPGKTTKPSSDSR